MHDVLVVGAGPVGLACGIEAKREGLQALIVEKGSLVNSIVGYPARMEFFSTPDLIEIGGFLFSVAGRQQTPRAAREGFPGGPGTTKQNSRLSGRRLADGGLRG